MKNQKSSSSRNGVFKEKQRSSLTVALLKHQVSLAMQATKSKPVFCLCLTRQIKNFMFLKLVNKPVER